MSKSTTKKASRIVVWTDETMRVEGGYRIAIVTEGESGYQPTGDHPYEGKPGQLQPWIWGPTIEAARAVCDDYNEKMGVDKESAFKIVTESIALGIAESKGRRARRG